MEKYFDVIDSMGKSELPVTTPMLVAGVSLCVRSRSPLIVSGLLRMEKYGLEPTAARWHAAKTIMKQHYFLPDKLQQLQFVQSRLDALYQRGGSEIDVDTVIDAVPENFEDQTIVTTM